MLSIAINGFGRIGRTFLRTIVTDKNALSKLQVTVINIGPEKIDAVAHMFKYDTILGTFHGIVELKNNTLIIDDKIEIKIIAETDPKRIDWSTYNIDWVVDASGQFTTKEKASQHINSGAKNVLISAPAKNEDITIIPGVNMTDYKPGKDHIVSLGSCTTNAFVTMLKVLEEKFGIEQGYMTTIHAYTNTQVLLDVQDGDLRRSRAAALNIIPTTTGAAKLVGKIMPALDGKIDAVAVRVPVAIVSLIDLVFLSKTEISSQSLNDAFCEASEKTLKGIINFSNEPLVSSDYVQSPFSVTIDGLLTQGKNKMGKLFGWYDNEWGYSMRLRDFLLYVSQL